jgi:hypothetical protein
MKLSLQVAFASVVSVLVALAPASAYARTSNEAPTHTQTYHDRTPRVHTHGTHSHRH